jgi:hypothetical protein
MKKLATQRLATGMPASDQGYIDLKVHQFNQDVKDWQIHLSS